MSELPQSPQDWQPQSTPPAPKKHRRWPWTVGGVVAVFVVIGVAAAVTRPPSGTSDGQPAPTVQSQNNTPAGDYAALPPPTTTAPTFSTSDFTVALKITDKECFGSAGCDITAEPGVTYGGDLTDLDTVTLSLTYELTGDQSGTQIHTLDCTDGQCSGDEVIAETSSRSTTLKAHVTEVDVQ